MTGKTAATGSSAGLRRRGSWVSTGLTDSARGLAFLGLDPTDKDLLELVTGLSPVSVPQSERAARAGECLHRDLRGRLGLIKVLMPQDAEVARAILTTPHATQPADATASDRLMVAR